MTRAKLLAHKLNCFLGDERGTTAIEYALLGTLIGIALVATFSVLGDNVANMFGSGSDGATAAINSAAGGL